MKEEKKSYIELFKEIKFSGNDNFGVPKIEYIEKLRKMSNEELFKETKYLIYLSAYANNNPRSDYHWKVEACYGVLEEKRLKDYDRIHKEVMMECGF